MRFGDPTFAGWLIFIFYFILVYRCYFKYVNAKRQGLEVTFWFVVGGLMLLLGLNKQLDLQTIFEANMRELALTHGWYAQRRMMQMIFIVTLAFGLLTMLIILRTSLAKTWQQNKIVCFGLVLIAVFIVLRAAAFNHLNVLSTQSYWGFDAHALLELSALLVVFYGTYMRQQLNKNKIFAQETLKSLEVFCDAEGEDVYCPECNTKAVSKAVNQRIFKCKACDAIYTVHIR